MIARPITSPDEAPSACRVRDDDQHSSMLDIAIASTLATAVISRPVNQHRLAPEAVGQRTEQQLRYRKPEQIKRQRELHRLRPRC